MWGFFLGEAVNVRRGLFRLWVLFTACWAIGCAAVAYDIAYHTRLYPLEVLLPPSNQPDNFFQGEDPYRTDQLRSTHNSYQFQPEYAITLYVHNSVSHETFLAQHATTFTDRHVKPRMERLRTQKMEGLQSTGLTAVLVPAVLFIGGYALIWAFAGFRRGI